MMPGKLFTIGSILLLGMHSVNCVADPPGSATTYEITIPANDHRVAIVTASLTPADREFYMFPGANQLPQRWSTFVSDFQVRDEDDRIVPVSARDDGTWQLSSMPKGRVTISYRVRLDHEDHAWSSGVDGAAYWREWGVFYTARSLFVVNGDGREDITVQFQLPDHWQVTTPWQHSGDDTTRFVIPDHDVLATSMLFAGTHREVAVQQGPFELLLVLGGDDVLAQEDVFVDMTSGVLDYYVALMGDVPRLRSHDAAVKPVVIINQGETTDGEAIGNNISILLEPSGGQMSQLIARLIFAHELFHLWNGKSFTPSGAHSEWFKEGFTNYYALKALHHIGYLTDQSYLDLLGGFFYQRYDSDDAVGRLPMTNGDLKHEHWGLIYSGGLYVAIAQDLQIRAETGNERSVDDLMRFLFDEYRGNTYELDDIETALGNLNNASQEDFFDRYVRGTEKIDISQYLALADIDASKEGGQMILRVRQDADPDTAGIRGGLFGARH